MLIRVFRGLYRLLDSSRRVTANILFALFVVIAAVAVWLAVRTPSVPDGTVLEIDLNGKMVTVPSALSGGRNWIARLAGNRAEETVAGDVTDALQAAAGDNRIKAVVVRLDQMSSAGPATIEEIGSAMKAFRDTGRKVYAWSDTYSQAQWAIASYASEIYLHPMGEVRVKGLEATGFYLGNLLKKIGVTVNVAKAGVYKSAPETFTNAAPSPEALEAQRFWLNDEWEQLSSAMEKARGLETGALSRWMSGYVGNLRKHGGDAAVMAEDSRLVDGLLGWQELRGKLAGRSCAKGGCNDSFTLFDQYLAAASVPHADGDGAVGVITLEGEITDEAVGGNGNASAGTIVSLIRSAEQDSSVKAVVLRVNSPGGSALAAEKIREALVELRGTGKPVVAYFGDMAASGGYWVSTAAQRLVSSPMSITGSIGVFGIVPTFENAMSKLGVGISSESTGTLGISSSPLVPLSKNAKEAAQLQVEGTYKKFLDRVAEARKMTPEEVDRIGQGRVWTGRQAAERGLVDQLGLFDDAADAAANLAGLKESYALKFFLPEATAGLADTLLAEIAGNASLPSWLREAADAVLFCGVGRRTAEASTKSILALSPWMLR